MEMLGDYDKKRIKLLVTQKVEGDELEEGMRILRELYTVAKEDRREDVPLSELRVGLKCGGSDGFSGITANPLVGEFSDYLVAQGGTTILTEVPEMFGAETILMNRCKTPHLFGERCLGLWRSPERAGTQSAIGSRQRPCGLHSTGFSRLPTGAFHYRPGHTVWHFRPDNENLNQQHPL